MKVLICLDSDGHFNAVDISTPEKKRRVWAQMFLFAYKNGLLTEHMRKADAKEVYENGTLEELEEVMQDAEIPLHTRGVMEEVDVTGKFDKEVLEGLTL